MHWYAKRKLIWRIPSGKNIKIIYTDEKNDL